MTSLGVLGPTDEETLRERPSRRGCDGRDVTGVTYAAPSAMATEAKGQGVKEFVLEVPLRWGDMDAMAHLNNVMYFRLMEEARIQWFQRFNLPTLPTGEAASWRTHRAISSGP